MQSSVCTEANEHRVQLSILLLYSDLPICHAKTINESKRHRNNFTKSDYASKYEHLIGDGIIKEIGRISKSAGEMLTEIKKSNSSPIFTLHNSS